jgi:hypothetical protein
VLEPTGLYEVSADAAEQTERLDGPVLLVALDGFVDAGAAARLAVEALVEEQERARWPASTSTSWSTTARGGPRCASRPTTGRPTRAPSSTWSRSPTPTAPDYLLLAGPEPDVQWERFCAAVEQLIRRFGVRLVITLTAIPMAVPHTRPIGVTAHGTRPELTEGHEAWFATADVPGSAVGLLELRLGEAGLDAMGFAVHVPHYLARAEYPHAARVLLDHTGLAGGLYLPTGSLTKAAERADAEIAEQVAGSDEVRQVVQALERQYDVVASGRGQNSGGALAGELPSADELAAEVERFLAGRERRGRRR